MTNLELINRLEQLDDTANVVIVVRHAEGNYAFSLDSIEDVSEAHEANGDRYVEIAVDAPDE